MVKMSYKRLAYLLLAILSGIFSAAFAADINKTSDGVAIDGYDPTAYFTESRPVKGDPAYTFNWAGATWQFANDQARELFAENPEKYAPQFGGYCSNGLSDDHKIGADPRNWRIIDGKLYLFFSDYGREQWSGNVKSLIEAADETWQELKN
ncbi:YHS domain-containing (seleno)protein [Kaarinaea lacus]